MSEVFRNDHHGRRTRQVTATFALEDVQHPSQSEYRRNHRTRRNSRPSIMAMNYHFGIAPDEGYVIRDVIVDGASVGAVSSYTFSGVTSDHTIEARLRKRAIRHRRSGGRKRPHHSGRKRFDKNTGTTQFSPSKRIPTTTIQDVPGGRGNCWTRAVLHLRKRHFRAYDFGNVCRRHAYAYSIHRRRRKRDRFTFGRDAYVQTSGTS